MADWVLIPCLKALFAEFDRIAPSRDHASDGSIGDTVHQNEVSDHNPDEVGRVPILDVDNTLRESDLTMERVVQFLLGRCRSGAEKRLRYIIYWGRIWSASSGWVQKTYTGASPHTEHAHFSASYETKLEASTASWHLEDIPVAIPADQMAQLLAAIRAPYADTDKTSLSETEAGHDVLSQQIPDGTRPGSPQTPAWMVIEHLGQALVALQKTVDELVAAKPTA
jgi:hypothetical protein